LGGFLEECERRQGVISVEAVDCIDASDPARANATVELTASVAGAIDGGAAFSLSSSEVDGDGRIRLGFESADAIVPEGDYDVRVDVTGATVNDDGTVTLTLSVSTTGGERSWTDVADRTDDGSGRRAPDATDGIRDRDVPPFEDTELLAHVYESCDTFAEMADEIEMDVTAETVRRYMVDHDIHEPNSYDTDSDGDETDADTWEEATVDASATAVDGGIGDGRDDRDTPVVIADGIGLPDDVTVETLIETVRRSNTIYEFKREVGIERDRALDVLRELNLLDFFAGRLDSDVEREIRREEVIERLRDAPACQ